MKKVSSFFAVVTFLTIALPAALCAADINKELGWAVADGKIDRVAKLLDQGADINYSERYKSTPLVSAVARPDNIEMVKFLISRGADVNKGVPLVAAVEAENIEAIKLLLQKGAKINVVHNYQSLLSICVRKDNIEIVKLLKKYGADFKELDKYKNNLLYYAISPAMVELLVSYGVDANAALADKLSGKNSFEIVKKLLEHGADVNVTHYGNTLLFNADITPDVAGLLIDKGLDVNRKNSNNETALHSIASSNNIPLMKFLLSKGADINAKNKYGITPVFRVSNIDMLKFMLENGAEKVGSDGKTLLHYAAAIGNYDMVKYLIEKGLKVNAENKYEETPLHRAAFADIAELLIEAGAKVDAENNKDETPLYYVLNNRKLDVARVLVKHGADFDDFKKKGSADCRLLFAAADNDELPVKASDVKQYTFNEMVRNGVVEVVRAWVKNGLDLKKFDASRAIANARYSKSLEEMLKYLKTQGFDVSAKDKYGYTVLDKCVDASRFDFRVFKMLVDNGADVKKTDSQGNTLLHRLAGNNRFLPCVKLLLAKGADPNAVNRYKKETPLFNAGSLEIAEALIEAGADVNALNAKGGNVLFNMKDSEINIVKLLIDKGINVNVADRNGYTPLMNAAYMNYELVKMLIEAGADVNHISKYGVTPLNCVSDKAVGKKIIDVLLAAGADTSLAVFNAVINRRVNFLKYLVSKGENISGVVDKNNATPLFVCRDVVTARFLVDQGVYVNAADDKGNTALSMAIRRCDLPMIKYLISAGAETEKVALWIQNIYGRDSAAAKEYLKKFVK